MIKMSSILNEKQKDSKIEKSRDFIGLSRKGLSVAQMKEILEYTSITLSELSKIISISERQILRYDDKKNLKRNVSAQLLQIAALYEWGYEIFEDRAQFQAWMKSEIRALGFEKPISLLDTPFGIEEVKNILGRLIHGVYS